MRYGWCSYHRRFVSPSKQRSGCRVVQKRPFRKLRDHFEEREVLNEAHGHTSRKFEARLRLRDLQSEKMQMKYIKI